jgi:hypothetical protein
MIFCVVSVSAVGPARTRLSSSFGSSRAMWMVSAVELMTNVARNAHPC